MTRMEAARHKLRLARYGIAIAAAAGLGAFAVAAHASHPGTHQPATQQAASTGFSSIGPSYGAVPQVQSGGS